MRQKEIEKIAFVMRGFAVERYGSKDGIDHRKLAEKLVDNGIRSADGFEKEELCRDTLCFDCNIYPKDWSKKERE